MATTLLDKENLIPKAKKAANVATVNNTAGAASALKPVNVPASVAQTLAKSAAAQAQAMRHVTRFMVSSTPSSGISVHSGRFRPSRQSARVAP